MQVGVISDTHDNVPAVEAAMDAVLHGEQRPVIEALAASGEYDYVCHGHWHVREERSVGDATVLNPGAHFPTVGEAHRTVAVVDTGRDGVEFLDVDGSV